MYVLFQKHKKIAYYSICILIFLFCFYILAKFFDIERAGILWGLLENSAYFGVMCSLWFLYVPFSQFLEKKFSEEAAGLIQVFFTFTTYFAVIALLLDFFWLN